jgi:hypothetical protein
LFGLGAGLRPGVWAPRMDLHEARIAAGLWIRAETVSAGPGGTAETSLAEWALVC